MLKLSLLLLLVLCPYLCTSSSVWPSTYTSSIRISIPQVLAPATVYTGSIFYDATNMYGNQLGYTLNAPDNHRIALIVDGDSKTMNTVQLSNSSCSSALFTDVLTPLSFLSPTFLTDLNFTNLGLEYYQVNSVFYATTHWSTTVPQLGVPPIQLDYWQYAGPNTPFRFTWFTPTSNTITPDSWTPVILEWNKDFTAGWGEKTSTAQWLLTPASFNCKSLQDSVDAPTVSIPLQSPEAVDTTIDEQESSNTFTPPQSSPWPASFHARAGYTGNQMGLGGTDDSIAIELKGEFYYDSLNDQECNIWHDAFSGELSKTLITNGSFYAIFYDTSACVIPPIPIHGCLHPNWTRNLNYLTDEYLWLEEISEYQQARHYRYDAFGAGPDHSFNYWELASSGAPAKGFDIGIQFNGPVLDFPPYYQSMMVWSDTALGLIDIPPSTFSVSGYSCALMKPEVFEAVHTGKYMDVLTKQELYMHKKSKSHLKHAKHNNVHGPSHESSSLHSELFKLHQTFPLQHLQKIFHAHMLRYRMNGLKL